MKKKQTRFIGALIATVLMAGSAQSAIIARDEFNTNGTTPDYANGLYRSGWDINDTNGNATCTGGTIVGFGTNAWTTTSTRFDAYAQLLRIRGSTYGPAYVSRRISASVAGKTKAYARTSMRMRSSMASLSSAFAYGGFASSGSLGSSGGSTIGFKWDGSNWDLVLRYNNGSSTTATIMEDITTNTTYGIIWKMDDAFNSISVWVDETNLTHSADLVVTDWNGTLADIAYLSIGSSEVGSSGDVYIYDMVLADAAEDIGAIPDPQPVPPSGLLVREEFNTSSTTPDYTNGIYRSGWDLVDTNGNMTCSGGSIVGFDETTAWDIPSGQSSGTFFDAYAGLLRMAQRTYGGTYVGRAITNSMVGKTEGYAVTRMKIRSGSGASDISGFAWVGFAANNALGSAGGAAVGYSWDSANSQWNLALRYRSGGSPVVATVMTNVAYDTVRTIYWAMDDTADTIKVWVDENDVSATPDLVVTDWGGTVEAITHLSAGHAETGDSDVFVYEILLGDTPESIGMKTPPTEAYAEILSIEPVSASVVKLLVRADYPELCYPKSKTSLPVGTWDSVGHSTNGVAPFEVTNLTYSATSGSDFVIYVEATQNKKFFKIGAE